MSGLQQRLPLVKFLLQRSCVQAQAAASPSSSAQEHANSVHAGVSSSSEDVTARVAELLQRELGLGAEGLDLLVCTEVFDGGMGGAERMCREMGVPLLGKVPLDPALGRAAEQGRSVFDEPSSQRPTATAAAAAAVGAAEEPAAANGGAGGGGRPICLDALRAIVAKIVSAA